MNWKRRKTQRFYVTTDLQSPPHTWDKLPVEDAEQFYKSTPARTPTLESDVLVPLAQAAITGLLISTLAFPVGWYFWDLTVAAIMAFLAFMGSSLQCGPPS